MDASCCYDCARNLACSWEDTNVELKETFEKQGGKKFLKQYWHGVVLFTTGAEYIFLGKSRIALEILRLSVRFNIKQKLERKYGDE